MITTGHLYSKGNHRQVNKATSLCKQYLKDLTPNDVLLDIGCGTGEITQSLAAASGADVTGIDMNPDMIQYARLNNNDSNTSYDIVDVQVRVNIFNM